MEYRKLGKTLALLGILLVGEWSRGVQSVSTEEDLTITKKEKEALSRVSFEDFVKSVVFWNCA